MKRLTIFVVALVAGACAAPGSRDDTTAALPPIDTLKPASDSARVAGTTSSAAGVAAKTRSSATKTAATTKTGTARSVKTDTTKKENPNIGYDSVIRRPIKTMPTVRDTAKKP